MNIIGIIPARYDSSRFPGKPLIEIKGKTMIRRVYERAFGATCLEKLIVATDDERIFDEVKSFGGNVEMTSKNHRNGTERCAEVADRIRADYYINIQGDEPYIASAQVDELGAILNGEVQLGTLVKKIKDSASLDNPGVMKVILNKHSNALYFSRSAIPFLRDSKKENWINKHTFWKHIGIYAYRKDILSQIVKLTPSSLEIAESLEQLRWLENGYSIKVAETKHESMSIDTPNDLETLIRLIDDNKIS